MSLWLERASYLMALERCVRCGKQDAYTMSGHQRCYDCTEKGKTQSKMRNDANHEELRQYRLERYKRLKSEGICVSCGKRKATFGVKCEKCRAKFNNYQKEKTKEVYNDGKRNS